MENNKYYTPDLSEFHIGFEYEDGGLDCEGKTGVEWAKKIALNEDLKTVLKLFDVWSHLYRVKLLDREDIEACGWIWSDSAWRVKERGVMEKEYSIGHKKLFLNDSQVHIIHEEYYGDASINIFKGEIKNISELRRLMKQLKIE